uniref:Putative retrotransposon protein n=1 Tax=Tanacetum cinerariifolium TaxID=118510 RepID=A0A699REB1_TANCI|nr:putative retrotransposon protein [Tanacetum cinerariifolium]
MENSKRRSIPMQDKLRLSKSEGASTPTELKRMQNVLYALAVDFIMFAVRCTRHDVADDIKRELRVFCYTDAGYLMDVDYLKSQTRYVFVLNGGVVDWKRITKGARHFRAKVHYLREVIEYGDVKLEKVHTNDNLADPFTKALTFPKHLGYTKNIGMLFPSSLM